MITELGHFALILAFVTSLCVAVLPLAGLRLGMVSLAALAVPATLVMAAATALSFAALVAAFVTSDFSVALVAAHSHSTKPLIYKISGTWGNHEGSLLLWILILALFGGLLALRGRAVDFGLKIRTLAVQAMVTAGFLAFCLFTSNPFARLETAPLNGRGLNPILQDPGLALHPPTLYVGYVGLSLAFAFAVAGLIEGRIDRDWARHVRPWVSAAWCALTAGIALGSWWAYYELGWGGWWFWDPVENASLLPWLSGTALMHSLAVTEKRGVFKSWTVLLAIVTFSLSLLGTFLVRSGVLTSVHAFASDPERGVFLLGLLAITVIASLTLYAVRAPVVHVRARYGTLSREIFLLLNNVLLVSATVLVAVGTLYPLVLDYLEMGKLSIGEPFFNLTFSPLAVATGLLLGAGIFSRWKKTDGGWLGRKLLWPLAVSLVGTAAILVGYGGFSPWAFVGVFAALWVTVATLWDLWDKSSSRKGRLHGLKRQSRSYYGMVLGHLGLAITMAGATIVSNYGIERDVRMEPGDVASVGDYQFAFREIGERQGANFTAQYGRFDVIRDGEIIAELYPEKRQYPVGMSVMTEADIDAGLFRDIFVAIGERITDNAWAIRLQYKPLVRWLWLGSVFMAAGGFLAIADRRYRIRERSRATAKTASPVTGSGESAGVVS
ncbi:MAG: heme lyase CcmF/NrfE family subunit [Pseudomonadota bacterium]|nr:heme lyase CcmF/NrfE family subunit [Pseudomonadota bacterium]